MGTELIDIVNNFLLTIEQNKGVQDLRKFYHPDIEQIEFPNLLVKNKTVRNLEDITSSYEKGKQVLQKESYRIINSYTDKNTVIIEAEWIGVLAIAIGDKKVGDEMKANFAQFYEFENGKIVKQRNYDCFDAF